MKRWLMLAGLLALASSPYAAADQPVLFEGVPFADISILERPDESLAVIMKDGVIVQER